MRGNNISRGADVAAQRSRALARTSFRMGIASLLAGVGASIWDAHKLIAPSNWPWIKSAGTASVLDVLNYAGHAMRLPNGSEVNSKSWLHGIHSWLSTQIYPTAVHAGLYGLAWAIATFFVLLGIAWSRGRRMATPQHVRGGKLVSARRLWWMLVWRLKASDIRIGQVPMARKSEVQHLLVTGAPGTGKSVLISSILARVEARKQPCVVYDKKGDLVQKYYRRERGDIVLNPMDDRCPTWDPWAEARHEADFDRIAAAIIPSAPGEAAFWHQAARSILSNALLKMWGDPSHDVPGLLRVVLNGSLEELAELLVGTDAQILLSPENKRTADSVRTTLNTYLRALRFLPPRQEGVPTFSMRDWVERGDLGWIFITSSASLHPSLRPLISCWVDCLISSVLSLRTSHSRRVWLMLDELASLQRLESLPAGLEQGRGYGLAVVVGVQNIPQLRERYGQHGAESLVGFCSSQIFFRTNDPDSSEWVSRSLGNKEQKEHTESVNYGGGAARDGVNHSMQQRSERLVTDTQIGRLPDLSAYVKLAGHWPIALTKLKVVNRPDIAEPFVPASEPKQQMVRRDAIDHPEAASDQQKEHEREAGRGML